MAAFMNIHRRNRRPFRRERRMEALVDHLAQLDDAELYNRYRFDRDGIDYITQLIGDDIAPLTKRSRAIPADVQVLIALRYFASGSFQQVVGDVIRVSQPTVSRIVDRVVNALVAKLSDFVKFPTDPQEIARLKDGFFNLYNANFAGVVGCIDCTHIRIIAPFNNEGDYVNRKSFHSINCQAVCDFTGKFTSISANWPGSAHDSWVLKRSQFYDDFETGRKSGLVLGDSGYPCRNWLITPYLQPQTDAEKRFNTAHKRTRVIIEQAFGRLKRRFGLLHGEVRKAPQKVCREFAACCILHNIATERKLPLLDEWQYDEDQPDDIPVTNGAAGRQRRDQLAQTLFGRP